MEQPHAIADLIRALSLKGMDAALLIADIRAQAERAGMDLARIDSAIELASYAHRDDRRLKRGDMPRTSYIEHPLRNAARVLRWGVSDEAIVIACVLHDTVEDHAIELADVFEPSPREESDARELVFAHYAEMFGARSSELVRAMSNPLGGAADAEASKHEKYREHVLEVIHDPGVAVCKLADLTDNALSLQHTRAGDGDKRTAKLARKYGPLLPAFVERVQQPDVRSLMSKDGIRDAVSALEAGIQRLSALAAD